MTTPRERLRALSWGRELLELLSFQMSVTPNTRRVALDFGRSFPTAAQLVSLVADESNSALPPKWAEAIEGAGRLFRQLDTSQSGSAEIQSLLFYTLRHYPLSGETSFVVEYGISTVIGPWIE